MIHPLLYELNTRCWLQRLSTQQGKTISLANVPEKEITRWRKLGFTHIWAMGAWTIGKRCREMALRSNSLKERFSKILSDWNERDVTGSPYSIEKYEVSAALGGKEGLKKFRRQLNAHGLKLILDFVPNHVGLDHRWVTEQPEFLMQSPREAPGTFSQQTKDGLRWLAHGRDPNFPPWSDTAQVNYRRPEARAAITEILQDIAGQCDGARCDMAMLVLNDVFTRTWAHIPDSTPMPSNEFWQDAIAAVRREHPDFLFLAEAYWGLKPRLQELGFDYTYCKTIYDRLLERDYAGLQKELLANAPEYVNKSAHFLENHDERRIASIFSLPEHCAAALVTLGLPGMRIIYEGQLSGARIQVPVQLARWPDEPVDAEISAMYQKLLTTLKNSAVGQGDWHMLTPDARTVIAIVWQKDEHAFDLIVVNLTAQPAHCHLRLMPKQLAAHDWRARDLLGKETSLHHGGDLEAQGLSLNLKTHDARLMHFQRR